MNIIFVAVNLVQRICLQWWGNKMGLGSAEKLEKHTLVKVAQYSLINKTGRTGGDGDITQQTSKHE